MLASNQGVHNKGNLDVKLNESILTQDVFASVLKQYVNTLFKTFLTFLLDHKVEP